MNSSQTLTNEAPPANRLSEPLSGRWGRFLLLSIVLLVVAVMVSPSGALLSSSTLGPGAVPAPRGSVVPLATEARTGAVDFGASPSLHPLSAAVPVSALALHLPTGILTERSLARPADGSTAQNTLLFNLSYSSTTTLIGKSNSSTETAIYSWNSIANGSVLTGWDSGFLPSASFFQSGLVELVRTVGGTVTYATPPANSTWSQTGATDYGSVWGAGNALFGGSFSVPGAEPLSIASNSTGNLLMAGLFTQACSVLPPATSFSTCNSTANVTAPQGVAVARSPNGGADWVQTADIAQWVPFTFVDIPAPTNDPNCVGGTAAVGWLTGNTTYGTPSIAMNPVNGDATVAWTEAEVNFGGKFSWSSASGSCQLVIGAPVASFDTYTSTTTDGGVTWSAPVLHSNDTLFPTLSVGPAPNYDLYLVGLNGSVSPTAAGYTTSLATSTTNGSSWSAMKNLKGPSVFLVKSLPDDSINYQVSPIYSLAVNRVPGSSHEGTLYLVWADNRSFSAIGEPSVAYSSSSNGGATWSSPVYLTANLTGITSYANPKITVDSNGYLWVTFYAASSTSGEFTEQGVVSTDGGAKWSPIFQVSDQTSLTGPSALANFGPNTGLVGSSNGAYATWSDCRDVTCANLNEQIFSANIHTVNVSSNVVGINVSVSSPATNSVVSAPGMVVILNGSTVRAQVPQFAPDNATYVYEFSGWSGLTTSLQDPVSFTYGGQDTSLTANYIAVPAAFIIGFVGPNVPSLSVHIGSTPATLVAHNGTTDAYNETVPAGPSYLVTISAGPGYQTYTTTVPTSRFEVVQVSAVLPRTTGWINGTITPAAANVTINGTAPAIISPGVFSLVVPWGTYEVQGSLTGYAPFFDNVSVNPRETTSVAVTLVGGYIHISVVPTTAFVQVDGVPQKVSAGSFTTAELPGGTHVVTATAPGYSLFKWDVVVVPEKTTPLTIKLTNEGWINGSITPVTGHVQINQNYITVNSLTGLFNVTEPAGRGFYNVTGSAGGYETLSFATVAVSPGNVTYVPILLTQSPPTTNCTQTNTCPPQTKITSTTGLNPIYLYAAIGVIVILVAAIAVVMLTRRGGGGSPGTSSASPTTSSSSPSTYDGSNPGDLPKMQSDGSMNSPGSEGEGSPPA